VDKYRLTDEQVAFYTTGLLKGIRILTDEQIEKLRTELVRVFQSAARRT